MVTQDEVSTITESSSIEITDVNVDCLEHVFKHLNLDDLVNVANTNSWVRTATGWTIAHKFDKKTVILRNISMLQTSQQMYIWGSTDEILITNLKKSLHFLRCFGHLVTKLEISHLLVAKKYQTYISHYISKYCINLIEITFSSCTEDTFAMLKNVFTNVQKVRFVDCQLGSEMSQLNELFPNLLSLEFNGFNEVFDRTCIAVQFPHLEQFATNLIVANEKYGFGMENVINAIKMNPKIQSLHIHWDNDQQFFENVNEQLKNLHTFKFDCFEELLPKINEDDGCIVHFNIVKTFQMSLTTAYNIGHTDHRIPFEFNALENFVFESDNKMEQLFFDFIEKHPTITKLTLVLKYKWTQMFMDDEHIDRIAEMLPSLVDVNTKTFNFTEFQALRFVEKLKNLRRFQFTLTCSESFDGLIEGLPGWKGTMDTMNYVQLTHVGDVNKKFA